MTTDTDNKGRGGGAADKQQHEDNGWSSQRVLRMEEALSDVRRLERQLSGQQKKKQAEVEEPKRTREATDVDPRDVTPPRCNSASTDSLDEEFAMNRPSDDSVSTLGASTHLSVELEQRLANGEIEAEAEAHKHKHEEEEEEAQEDRPPSLSVEDMAAAFDASGGSSRGKAGSRNFYDSGLVTEVHRNNARLRRGSDLRLSLSTEEEEVDDEEEGETIVSEIDSAGNGGDRDHHHVSMSLADFAQRSFRQGGGGGSSAEKSSSSDKHHNSTNTVDELQAAAATSKGSAGLAIPTGAANSTSAAIDMSSSTSEDDDVDEDMVSDIGASNSTREGFLGTRSTRSSITNGGYATGVSSITGPAGSGSLYPNLLGGGSATGKGVQQTQASPHVPDWTPPDHDFMAPLTDGRKRPKRIRNNSLLLKKTSRRTNGDGGAVSGTGTGARTAAKGRGRKSAAALAREASTDNLKSIGSDDTPKTTQRKEETNAGDHDVPDPTDLNRFQSDTTAETFDSHDHHRDNGHQFQASTASLDPSDVFGAAHQHKGADSTPRSTKRVAKGRRMLSSSDHGERMYDNHHHSNEVDDYSFAPSLEPDSREPSLYNGSSHHPRDDGYLIPLKSNSPPKSADQQPRRSRQLDRSQRTRRSTRTTRRSRSNSFSSASMGSFVNDMIDRAASAIGGGGGGEDMTRSGEVTTEEAGGLLDNVDAEDDDGSAEYIDLQDDDDMYSQDNSWVPSVVGHPGHSSGVSLDDTAHSRLTMDEGLYAALGNSGSGSVTHEHNSRRQSSRRAGRRPHPPVPAGFSSRSRSRSRSNESRDINADGQSFDGSHVSFHDSVGSESLLDEDELAQGHGGRSRSGSRGSHRSRSLKRRPSIDMIDELAKKVGERIMRQQRRCDRSLGDYSISNGGIPDLHDDNDSYDNESRIGGIKYAYDDRKDSSQFSRRDRSGFLHCNNRIALLLAAAAAIIVALTARFGGDNSGGITIGPATIVQQVDEDESLVPDISRAVEDELERRAKQIKDLNTAHSKTERDGEDPDEIFAAEDGEAVDISTVKKNSPTKLKPLRVLIECTRDDGCFEAMQDSVNVHVESLKDSHMVSIDIDDDDFDKLRSLKHVKSIDLDFNLGGIEDVLIDESEIDEEDREEGFELLRAQKDGVVKEGPRTLAQTIPVGATMVQAVDYDGTPFPTGSSPKTICIADTGACREHPDISSNPDHLWGTDMVVDGRIVLPWAPDRNGHGCHLTGLIAALDNSVGYHGISAISGGVKIFSTRALDDEMSGSISQMQRAIDQCVSNDADIIVLSLGCQDCYSRSLDQYFDRIAKKNILIFAAAGNNGAESYPQPFYPATYPSVISVGAVNKHRGRWYMSNRNYGVELCAHGYYVYSTDFDIVGPDNFAYNYNPRAGTSMAAPQVAAVAALLWSHFPRCTSLDIRAALAKSAQPHAGFNGCNDECGHGIVQLRDAYDLLQREGCSGVHENTVLSNNAHVCDCVDSGNCLQPVQSGYQSSSSAQQTNYLPRCVDNNRARFRIGRAGRRRGREMTNNNRRRMRRCSYVRKGPRKRAINWCQRSVGARNACKATCSTKAGLTYTDCRSPSSEVSHNSLG